MWNQLEHISKMAHELDRSADYNFIDRSDKRTYNAKIESQMKRKTANNERLIKEIFAPPARLIEPVHTPEPEYQDLPRF